MNVVVTGGVGKLGEWTIRELLPEDDERSAKVTVLDHVTGAERPAVS